MWKHSQRQHGDDSRPRGRREGLDHGHEAGDLARALHQEAGVLNVVGNGESDVRKPNKGKFKNIIVNYDTK